VTCGAQTHTLLALADTLSYAYSQVLMGKPKSVKALLSLGADVTIGEKDGYIPVHGAVRVAVSQWCYSGFAIVSKWCYSAVTVSS
jgi:hypothetical protein